MYFGLIQLLTLNLNYLPELETVFSEAWFVAQALNWCTCSAVGFLAGLVDKCVEKAAEN